MSAAPTDEIASWIVRSLADRFPEATNAELADACSSAFVWHENADAPRPEGVGGDTPSDG